MYRLKEAARPEPVVSPHDRPGRYLVFITPQDNSRHPYVTHKTSAGFAVMEADNGRDSVAFDYRIVAKPYHTAAPDFRFIIVCTQPRFARTHWALRHSIP